MINFRSDSVALTRNTKLIFAVLTDFFENSKSEAILSSAFLILQFFRKQSFKIN